MQPSPRRDLITHLSLTAHLPRFLGEDPYPFANCLSRQGLGVMALAAKEQPESVKVRVVMYGHALLVSNL